MAKEIKFNIKLNVDGKESLVSATSSVEELRRAVDASKTSAQKLTSTLVNFNQKLKMRQKSILYFSFLF